jgi:hypothetical protein
MPSTLQQKKTRCGKTKIEDVGNNVAITFCAGIKKRKKWLVAAKKMASKLSLSSLLQQD